MTAQELELLGFEKIMVSAEESGYEPFHYYVMDIIDGLSFISNDNQDAEKNGWYIEFFNTDSSIKFNDYNTLSQLITLINNGRVK